MTAPDTNTITIVLFSVLGWVFAWFSGRRNGARREAARNAILFREHNQMYADWKEKHEVKSNGGSLPEVT